MKNLLLTIFICSLTFFQVNSQVTFSILSPEEDQANFDITYASGGGWYSMPDMLDVNNAVKEETVFFVDRTSGDSLGCEESINTAQLQGKIAVVFRGVCEFSFKAYNAQEAGAIAIVIINNVEGNPVGMAAGTYGDQISIPTVMLGLDDGLKLLEVMKSNTVEAFIGNKTGFYPNDLGTDPSKVIRSQKFGVHSALAESSEDFDVEVGGWVHNYGFNDQTNVRLNATVTVNGAEIYNESSDPMNMLAGDSSFIELPLFTQNEYPIGYYHLTYEILSDSIDDYDFDNTVSADFAVNDTYFSLSSLSQDDLTPISPGGLGIEADLVEPCIVFQDQNASRVLAEGITFSAYTAAASGLSLDGIPITVRAMKWNDEFEDMNDPNFGLFDLEEVEMTEFYFEGDPQGENVTVNFDEPILLENNQRYLFCMMTFENDLFFGYDRTIDYEENRVNRYNQPLFPINVDGQWFSLGFGDNAVPAIGVNMKKDYCKDVEVSISGIVTVDTITIEVTGFDLDYTLDWEGEGTVTPIEDDDSHVIVSDNGDYTVTATDINGCTGIEVFTVSEIIEVCDTTEINIIGTVNIDTISVEVENEGAIASYEWSGIGAINLIDGYQLVQVTENGYYTLTLTDTNECVGLETFFVDGIIGICDTTEINITGTVEGDIISVEIESYAPIILGEWYGPGDIVKLNDFYEVQVSENGYYTLVVIDENNCIGDEIFTVEDITNVGDIEANNINVYPNPAKTLINFDVTGAGAKNIYVFDATGRAIATLNVTSDVVTYKLEGFETGMYMYHITNQDGTLIESSRFVIVK